MKLFITALVAALSFVLTGCGGTQQDRADSADQVFGAAKMTYVGISTLVAGYNLLPACADNGPQPPLCYSEAIGDIANKSVAGLGALIDSTEKIFAAANTEGAKLDAAKAVKAAGQELLANLVKFGIAKGAG